MHIDLFDFFSSTVIGFRPNLTYQNNFPFEKSAQRYKFFQYQLFFYPFFIKKFDIKIGMD